MQTANYNYTQNQNFFSTMTQTAMSFVQFHAFDAPILNQWHQLIAAIREKANTRQWVTLINPPFIPNDDYMAEIGLGEHYVRVIRLNNENSETTKYIQRCLQNGKSSVVAIWASQQHTLPDVLLNETPLGCQALVFTNSAETTHLNPQLEMAL
jgi:cell division inhibitor SulA